MVSLGDDGLGFKESAGKKGYMHIAGMLRELCALSMCIQPYTY